MNKIIRIISTIIQLLLLAGCFIIEYFARNRMGMMRHMAYVSRKWRERAYIPYVGTVIVVLLILCLIYVIYKTVKKAKITVTSVTFIICALLTAVYIPAASTEIVRCYYYIAAALVVISALQGLKLAVVDIGTKQTYNRKQKI